MTKKIHIGVLALQGDVEPHCTMVERCGAIAITVRRPEELEGLQGLLLPGGESTTMTKLLDFSGLYDVIIQKIKSGMAVWGTCAGTILLGKQGDDTRVKSFGLLDIHIQRNAYGRQTESFTAPVKLTFDAKPIEGVFIRSPIIEQVGKGIEIIGTLDSKPVHLEFGRIWVSTFHPELTDDERLHRRFITMCMDG